MGFYFRDVYEILFARRYATASILAKESLEGHEVVCHGNGLPCSANSDCGPEGKPCSNRKELSSNARAAVARLNSSAFNRHQAAGAKSREEIGVRNAAEKMFMIAWARFINFIFLHKMSTVD